MTVSNPIILWTKKLPNNINNKEEQIPINTYLSTLAKNTLFKYVKDSSLAKTTFTDVFWWINEVWLKNRNIYSNYPLISY